MGRVQEGGASRWLPLVFLALVIAGCGNDHPTRPQADSTPPSAISDLQAVESRLQGRSLTWTTPGDDGEEGQATFFDLRYSADPITIENWAGLSEVDSLPEPAPSGTEQSVILPEDFRSGSWYFALRTADAHSNWSGLSNVAYFDAAAATYRLADTPDQLIENFTRAQNELDFDEYDHLLAHGFEFWIAPTDVDAIGLGSHWDRAADVASTFHMFSGQPGLTPTGTVIPPVRSLSVTLDPSTAWTDAGGDVIEGQTTVPGNAKRAVYSSSGRVYYTDEAYSSTLTGYLLLYAIPVVTTIEGQSITEWKLVLWRDFGIYAKGGNVWSWSRTKALF